MSLSEKQRRQADAIASLVTQPDRAAITQGVELAAALDDQEVFAELLAGMSPMRPSVSRFPNHVRYPTPQRAELFDQQDGNQAWLDLAMIHLLAASDLPLRESVRSIALGTPVRKFATPAPELWIDGLERLTELTHLDLHLRAEDQGIELRDLERFANLAHLRVRGTVSTGPIPSMKNLETLDGTNLQIEPNASFPALKSLCGRVTVDGPITPERMPNLKNVWVRGDLRLEGFDSLDTVSCARGVVALIGCERIEHLSVAVETFDAPDLRHVGLLDRGSPGLDVSQLETLDEVKLNRRSKFVGGVFPKGTKLLNAKIVLWGPAVVDLGNIGELDGLEILLMSRVSAPLSLETLRHATDLRVLDIRHSPGITDLSPLFDLANLEILVTNEADRFDMPSELRERVKKMWRTNQPIRSFSPELKKRA